MAIIHGWSKAKLEDRARPLAYSLRRAWRHVAGVVYQSVLGSTYLSVDDVGSITKEWLEQLQSPLVMGYVRRTLLDSSADARAQLKDLAALPDVYGTPGGETLVADYLRSTVNRLQHVGADVWLQARERLVDGMRAGEPLEALAAGVRDATGVPTWHAMMIARTEVHSAHEMATLAQVTLLDPDAKKTWRDRDDQHVRDSHAAVDGTTLGVHGVFIVGGYPLRCPGDPMGPPHEVLNCRCGVDYELSLHGAVSSDIITGMTASDHSDAHVTFDHVGFTAAGKRKWNPLLHPRGNDGKFIEKGGLFDLLTSKKLSSQAVAANVGSITQAKWNNLTSKQQQQIVDVVESLPTSTFKKTASGKLTDLGLPAIGAPKTPSPQTPTAKTKKSTPKLKTAKVTTGLIWGKHADKAVILEREIDGVQQRVRWDAQAKKYRVQRRSPKSNNLWKTETLLTKKDAYEWLKGDTDWKLPNTEDTDAPSAQFGTPVQTTPSAPEVPTQTPQPPPTVPTKAAPGEAVKVTTSLIWGKHSDGDIILITEDADERIRWDGAQKKYVRELLLDDGSWGPVDSLMSKKQAYDALKNDTHWTKPSIKSAPSPVVSEMLHAPVTTPTLESIVENAMKAETQEDWKKLQAQAKMLPVSSQVAGDFSEFKQVGSQQGSNLGGWFEDENGDRFYVKKAKTAKHAANEQLAASLYNLAGVDTPAIIKGDNTPGLGAGTHTATPEVKGAKPNLQSKLSDDEYLGKIREGFAVDAWLANWDVAGLVYDNVVEGEVGQPVRIDVGGALLFRAQGVPKGAAFGDEVTEIDTLRDSSLNSQSAKIFGSMTEDEMRESAKKLLDITPKMIDQAVKDAGFTGTDASKLSEKLKKRRANILKRFDLTPGGVAEESPVETSPLSSNVSFDTKEDWQANWDKGLVTTEEFEAEFGELPAGATLSPVETSSPKPLPKVAVTPGGQPNWKWLATHTDSLQVGQVVATHPSTYNVVTYAGNDEFEFKNSAAKVSASQLGKVQWNPSWKGGVTEAQTPTPTPTPAPASVPTTAPAADWAIKSDGTPNWSAITMAQSTLTPGQVVATGTNQYGEALKIEWTGDKFVVYINENSVDDVPPSVNLDEVAQTWMSLDQWKGVMQFTPDSVNESSITQITEVKSPEVKTPVIDYGPDDLVNWEQVLTDPANSVGDILAVSNDGLHRVTWQGDDQVAFETKNLATGEWNVDFNEDVDGLLHSTSVSTYDSITEFLAGEYPDVEDWFVSHSSPGLKALSAKASPVSPMTSQATTSEIAPNDQLDGAEIVNLVQQAKASNLSADVALAVSDDGVYRLTLNPSATYNTLRLQKWDGDQGQWETTNVFSPGEYYGNLDALVVDLSAHTKTNIWLKPDSEHAKVPTSVSTTQPTSVLSTSETTSAQTGDISSIPTWKQKIWKKHFSTAKIGYYSKPQAIWDEILKVLESEKVAGNSYTPLQVLNTLDAQTKTKDANPWTAKITKWAQTAKGSTAVKGYTSSASDTPTLSTSAPTLGNADLGDGDTSQLSASAKKIIFDEFKSQGTPGVASSPEKIWKALDHASKMHGVTHLHVLRIVDEISASNASKPNQNLLEKKIVDWLKTPQGHAIATGQPVPKPETPKLYDKVSFPAIPARAESDKYTYETVTVSGANTLWDKMISATGGVQWTTSQRAALKQYTGGFYTTVNRYLFGKSPTIDQTALKQLHQIQLGMRPSTQPLELHRRTNFDEFGVHNATELHALVGQTRKGEAFLSTNVGSGWVWSGNVDVIIEAPPGTPMAWVKPISQHSSEDEMVLAAGLNYQILSVTKQSGFNATVRLRVVP